MMEEVKNWFKQAKDDLGSARANLNIKKYYIAALFAQQSAEKALKAFYLKKFKELRKTHHLVFLAKKLDLPEDLRMICKKLDPVYVQARYPDASGKLPSRLFNKEEAADFIKISREILKWIEKKLS